MESFFMIMGAGGAQGVVHELPRPPTTHPRGASGRKLLPPAPTPPENDP